MVLPKAALLASLLFIALNGQAAAAAPPVRMEIVTAPAVGAETTAKKGQPIAVTNAMEAVDAITTQESYSAGGLTVPAGRLSMWRDYPDGKLYQALGSLRRQTPEGEAVVVGGVFVPNAGKPPQLYWNSYTGPIFIDAPGIAFTETPYRRDTLSSARSDLVYTGLMGGKPGFLYREFDGDLVRPASTEATETGPGGELQTHGGRIRVVSAGEDDIRYVVLKPLDPPVFERPPPPEPPPEYEFDEDNENGRPPMAPPAPSVPKGT